jgi:hypothetical protein
MCQFQCVCVSVCNWVSVLCPVCVAGGVTCVSVSVLGCESVGNVSRKQHHTI